MSNLIGYFPFERIVRLFKTEVIDAKLCFFLWTLQQLTDQSAQMQKEAATLHAKLEDGARVSNTMQVDAKL